jgi:hypothetical protein
MEQAEIPFLSVSQLSELIQSRQISPIEVVEGYLERIDRLNDRLYAYLTVCRDQAVEAARGNRSGSWPGANTGVLSTAFRWRSKTSPTRRASVPPAARPFSTILFPLKTPR